LQTHWRHASSRAGSKARQPPEVLSLLYLRGEVPDDIGRVATPQGAHALVFDCAGKALADALVGLTEAALLDHLVLVLDEQLDALNGGSCGLADSS
jgi:hypothetical protein